MTDLNAIIEKLEKAEEGSGSLDLDIWFAVNGLESIGGYRAKVIATGEIIRVSYSAPSYTTSIDAALTLVPDGHSWLVENDCYRQHIPRAWVKLSPPRTRAYGCNARAPTPALALCMAALKARNQ